MAKLISNRYAYALFEAGLELNKLDEFKKDLEAIVHTLDMEPQIQDILSHPKISKDEKKGFCIKCIWENGMSRDDKLFICHNR